MSPLSRPLFLVYQRKVFIASYVMRRPQIICAARALSRLRCASLSWLRGCSCGEIVGGVSLLVLFNGIIAGIGGGAGAGAI